MRVHLVEWKLMSKSKNKINNISADIFAGRTSQPSYINEKGVYPPKSGVDARVLSQSKAALLKYGLFQSSTKESLSSNIQRTQEFISPLTAIDLLSRLMIFPSYDAAQKSFQHVWDGSWIGWFKNQPAPRDNLGCEMHGMSQHQAALELITVAVFGVFYGGFGWWRFSKVLIQGAWPWLNGYNKAYAKAVFSVILGLFAVVETGRVDNRGAGALMLQLASTLVARPGSLSNSVRVRGNNRLKAPKAKVYGTYIPPKGDKAGVSTHTHVVIADQTNPLTGHSRRRCGGPRIRPSPDAQLRSYDSQRQSTPRLAVCQQGGCQWRGRSHKGTS